MKQIASLRVCVLGGRSFGKTSLLSSLIAVSGTKESGISALGDNQRKLAIYNDYKNGHGKLSATSWDDICKFRFKITGGGNRRWVVSFFDYPGEFFQKFEDENSGILNGVLAKLKTSRQAGKTKQEELSYGGETKNAKRIDKEILSADALIVLLPADSERTEYKQLLTTFKARLESLLQTIEERNPYIPVCLAINKSDMLENTAVEDLLERPVFAGFHNMLARERGQNYFYQTVSAFGGNRANGLPPDTENIEDLRQTWDGKSEPQNVLPMLIRISEMAEEGRYKLLRERFDEASVVARTLKWPLSWLHVRGLGANKEEDRKYCVKNLVQCVARLGAFALISAFFAFCAVSTVCSLNAWIGLRGYDKKLSSAEQSCKGDSEFILGKDVIKDLSESRPSQLGRFVFFCDRKLNDLKERYEHLEDDRNWRVFKSATIDCSGLKLCDGGDGMDVEERLKRFDDRIALYQNATNEIFGSETRITKDGTLASRGTDNLLADEKLAQIIGEESCLQKSLKNDKGFFQDLKKVNDANEKDFCREAESFLQKHQNVKVHLKGKCDAIRNRLNETESNLTAKADAYLGQHADNPDSENYVDRISKAKARIGCVTNLLDRISARSACRVKYDEEKRQAEELINDLNRDKPCYDALAALREDNRNIVTGKVRRVHAFLQAYAQYGRCERFMAPFRSELSNEVCRIQNECWTAVTNNSFDVPGITTGKKIERIGNQIKAYEIARDEYVIESDEYRNAEASIKQLRETRVAIQKLNGFENALSGIKESSYQGRLRALAELKDGYKDDLTDKQKIEIKELEKDALRYWQDYQSTNECRYAVKDDDALDAQMRNVGELGKVYLILKGEVLPNSSQYAQLEQKEKELADKKQSIELDLKLENAFRELPSTNAVERGLLLNAIDAFESKYHIADYTSKHGKKVFRQLEQRKHEAQCTFLSDYTNRIAMVQCPPETNFLGRCQWADACMKISEESYKGLGSNNLIRLRLEADYKYYANQHQRFAKLFGLASYANEIAGKSPTNDVEVACGRLREIKKFYSDYPPDNNHDPLVGAYYLRVKNTLAENNEVVSGHIDKGLREMDEKLPYGAPDEDKLKVWNEKKDLIGKYILVFVKETDPHRVYTQKLAELNKQYGITQRKVLFENGYKQLDAEIKNEQDLKRKLEKIKEFLAKNEDVCLNDFASDRIKALEKEEAQIQKDIDFNEYNGDLDKVVKDRPTEDADDSAFAKYKVRIDALKTKLDKFEKDSRLRAKCRSVAKMLQEQIEYIEKALGDGSWKDVQKKEEEYKANPCKETEKKLRSALDNFDEKRFGKYLASKKETEDRFKKDLALREKVLSAKVAFFENPNHSTFIVFKKAVDACLEWETGEVPEGKARQVEKPYGCKWPLVGECSSYILKIAKGIQVKLNLKAVGFDGSWMAVNLTIGTSSPEKIYKGYENKFQPRTETISYSEGLKIKAKYEDMVLAYKAVEVSIPFWDFVKCGLRNCQEPVKIRFLVQKFRWYGTEPEYLYGVVEFLVSDIPHM